MSSILAFFNFFRLIFLATFFFFLAPFLRRKSIYLFLKFAGPSFIKLGQTLSTRDDLVGEKMAKILSNFQDRLPPFSFKKVQKILKNQLGKNCFDEIFLEFNEKAAASASIAQVHKAHLKNGKKVAVKILRPKIRQITARDIKTLSIIIFLARFFSKQAAQFLQDVRAVLQNCAISELDLLKEAGNAIRFHENLAEIEGFYVPRVFLQFSTHQILVLEWIDGVPFSDKKAILATKFDKDKLAENLVLSYFHQLYQDGFFHADMHPGNLFLIEEGENAGKIAVIDFGIVGKIEKNLRIGLTEIFIAYLDENYKKVAKLHVNYGLVPKNTDIHQLAVACQKIGQRVVNNNVKDISLAELMKDLIELTSSYNMRTEANLLLLHKTLMLVEGVGVMLNPNLNIWQIAKPWVRQWAKTNIGFDAKIRDFVEKFANLVRDYARDL